MYSVSIDVLPAFRRDFPTSFVDAIDAFNNTSHARVFGWLRAHPPLLAHDQPHLLVQLTQCFELASFYYSHSSDVDSSASTITDTSSSSWRNADGWLNYTRHEREWLGCNCSDDGLNHRTVVTGIFLPQNGLTGKFSSPVFELALLHDGLMEFGLPGYSITGPLPSELGLLTKLLVLSLDGNSFSGTLPTELGQLRRLQALACRDIEGLTVPSTRNSAGCQIW